MGDKNRPSQLHGKTTRRAGQAGTRATLSEHSSQVCVVIT